MKAREIREGDIVEIDYVTEFTKEHMNEGKALVIWKGFNNQPLVRKLDTKAAIWTCYEYIARVVGHIDIVGYMDRALSAEPCEDCISRQAVLDIIEKEEFKGDAISEIEKLPSVNPQKIGHWIDSPYDKDFLQCSECGSNWEKLIIENCNMDYCPNCGSYNGGN